MKQIFLIPLLVCFTKCLCSEKVEPECYSRWDYEYKTVRQLAKTEDKQEQIEITTNKQQAEIEELKQTIFNIQKEGSTKSAFIRWGRTTCTDSTTIAYKGYIAGKHYNQHGSGSDTLCLPEDPTWSNYTDGNDEFPRSFVYGAEIDVNEPSNIFPYRVWEQDMPCVVCLSHHSITHMIPGRESCYPGWTTQYSGYLMAGNSNTHGSYNHICVDFLPEFIPNGSKNNNEHILYLVEVQCGSLPCPPYVQGRELACVVCSI